MGGRGASSGLKQRTQLPLGKTLSDVQAMSTKELKEYLQDVDMLVKSPDWPSDLNNYQLTQRLVYALGMNEKPQVVSEEEFDTLVKENGNPIIYRTVKDGDDGATGKEYHENMIYGGRTYLGDGIYGCGIYFSDNESGSKLYGEGYKSAIVACTLNSKAKVISFNELRTMWNDYEQANKGTFPPTYPSDKLSMFALLKGYNVIKTGHTSEDIPSEYYYNVLDRSVLTTTGRIDVLNESGERVD